MPSLRNWQSICWSHELRMFCAAASNGSNIIATSHDGIIWTQRTLPASRDWRSVCWSPELNMLCTVSDNNILAVCELS